MCRLFDSKHCITVHMLVDVVIFCMSGYILIFRIEISSAYVIVLPVFNFGKLLTYMMMKSRQPSTDLWETPYLAERLFRVVMFEVFTVLMSCLCCCVLFVRQDIVRCHQTFAKLTLQNVIQFTSHLSQTLLCTTRNFSHLCHCFSSNDDTLACKI
jgi:hypothetical protein